MDPKFFRKYADIITEAEKPRQQLDEGLMDMLRPLAAKFAKMVGADTLQNIAAQVKQVTGGDLTPSKENAMKVAKAFNLGQRTESMSEGVAGNWQGKLIQLVYSSGLLGSVAGGALMWGTQLGEVPIAAAMLLLMAIETFFGDGAGQVGAMGKYGNTGIDTRYGSDNPKRTSTI